MDYDHNSHHFLAYFVLFSIDFIGFAGNGVDVTADGFGAVGGKAVLVVVVDDDDACVLATTGAQIQSLIWSSRRLIVSSLACDAFFSVSD